MYPVTTAFREAVISSDQLAVVKADVVLDDSLLGTLLIESGSVVCDGTSEGALRSLSLTLAPDPQAFDWLAQAGAEIVVSRGLRLAGGDELVPLGVFILDADLEEASDGGITVNAADRSQRISRARWTDPYIVPLGTAVGTAIADLLLDRWPDCPIGSTLGAATKLTTARTVYLDGSDSDPWKNAREFASSAGYELYFDGDGVAQIRDTPDPETDPVCASYACTGAKSIVLTDKRIARVTQLYNGVIATAEGSGVDNPVRGEAWDEDPNSQTYCYGPMGRVPYFYSSSLLTTQDDVDSASETLLAKKKRPIEQHEFTFTPNPAHEAFDVIELVDGDDVARRYMLDVVTIPLDNADMSATARETEVA